MAQVVRAALLQTAWTGDKESMIRVHEDKVREAASAGAQVMCFQELFYGPYFCQVQDEVYFEYAGIGARPDGRALPTAGERQPDGAHPSRVRA